mmetsp:Transcript_10272/g.33808  ORF Transcript_10272/g.33808 Transcript_10272/m.33808 type:complete len:366 (+) Transcript_10272:50-1147(+)
MLTLIASVLAATAAPAQRRLDHALPARQSCSVSNPCASNHFCNFDYGGDGFCEPCCACDGDCDTCGLVNASGTNDCKSRCPASDDDPCPAPDDDPCFARSSAHTCRLLDPTAPPAAALADCFHGEARGVAEKVLMADLAAGDLVLSSADEVSRVILTQHKAVLLHSAMVRIEHSDGSLELTPDHLLRVDGRLAPAREVRVGSSLEGPSGPSAVTSVSRTADAIINPRSPRAARSSPPDQRAGPSSRRTRRSGSPPSSSRPPASPSRSTRRRAASHTSSPPQSRPSTTTASRPSSRRTARRSARRRTLSPHPSQSPSPSPSTSASPPPSPWTSSAAWRSLSFSPRRSRCARRRASQSAHEGLPQAP